MASVLESLLGVFGFGQPKDLDVEDPVTGLTPRQKNLVRSTWALVMPNIRTVSVELIITFFDKHPGYYSLFKSFEGLSIADLKTSKKFTAHATTVFHVLASVVDALEDTELLVELCTKLGKAHAGRNVPPSAFEDLKPIVMQVLSEKLGKKLTPSTAEAWDKTLTVAFSLIKKELAAPASE
ncbi:globin-like [Neocloeon triangulifer]|uniref:globin-like n=1 Tax=Neocloeon triangulifer TaxID=2078957 RepID=UPI00286F2928|nr:globin-like [Neocloeon triangulifer]XP_059486525.1 globin-like [Neocloeon triangulifer]